MKMPSEQEIKQLWMVAESDSLETGTEPAVIFAKLLYSRMTKTLNS
jgi:hypothetical protein